MIRFVFPKINIFFTDLSSQEIRLIRSSIDTNLNQYPNCRMEYYVDDPYVIELQDEQNDDTPPADE